MKFERLGNICTVRNGYAFKSELFNEDGVPVIRISDINGNYVTSENSIRTPYNEVFEQFKLSKGDILMAMSGATTGKYGIYSSEEVGYQNQRVGCFVIKDKSALDNNYLLQTLKYLKPKIERKAHGSGQPNISAKAIEDFEILLPSLPDQLHIANLLSKAENLIAQRKESIRLLDEFLKSTFLEMFGDPVRNEKGWESDILDNGCRRINVGFVGTCEKYYTDNSGIPLIRTGNLTDTFVDWKNLKYVTDEFHSANKKSQVSEGDILIARHGDNGKATLYKGEKGTVNTLNIVVASPNISIYNGYFLIYLLNNNSVRNLISSKTGGSTQKVVNTKTLQKLSLIVPPIELQTQFAQIVEKTKTLKTQYQQSLEELENLYGSLSQKAFNGELIKKI